MINHMKRICILGIYITNRVKDSLQVQHILTKYGCSVKTRLGLHEVQDDNCSPDGLILLELTGDIQECMKLENELRKIGGLEVQKMEFLN
jgi:hypothetical protein